MILPYSTIAQTSRNISLPSSLTARNDDNSSWPSPSGEFAFGFKQIGKDGFLLAIWFNKIPDRTIVWSANRNDLVQEGSKVELTSDGRLMLSDAEDQQVWSANDSARTEVAYAAMLDTGNFVLANTNSTNLWESFDQPTDTILPTQTLNLNSNLYARYTATNYTSGRFLFTLQSDGNLVLYTTYFPQQFPNFDYWSTQTTDIGFQVIFNQSGFIYLASRNGSVLNTISPHAVSIQNYYQRATLDYDGVLRHYVYPKNASSIAERRPMAWSTPASIPQISACQ
ncbi:G-type lectin S-receptor-like serine/threonine-protein kinase RLK1 [Prunus yedoensis var. nudiflora]|uniref:G-type lectin S-receptor-like serine/threonine-protein kinase RLK1 n=1 Tax=Prunus yedoensis var. nudiflora TaxID=2094558 RepID=A0A314U7P8_PRUYE|nr:G-type lectin S-receptor-like serine/threonine-protein kinase RLK1 [Prunus yedoensis var. nudiflora]